jgi:hypothetical protein
MAAEQPLYRLFRCRTTQPNGTWSGWVDLGGLIA